MCEPTTIVAIAGLALSAGAAYQQNKAQNQTLMYQSQVADNNAKTLELQAQSAEAAGQQKLIDARRQNDRLKGAQRNSFAARGLDLGEGTPAELQAQTDYFGQVDQNTIANNTSQEAWRIRVGAQNQADTASALATKGSSGSPLLAGATTLIGGAGSVAEKWYKYGATSTPAASVNGANIRGTGSAWFG